MPMTPVAGSRSSPRIRTSRSPRSRAPIRSGEAVLAHRGGRVLGPARAADRVDRHADDGPVSHSPAPPAAPAAPPRRSRARRAARPRTTSRPGAHASSSSAEPNPASCSRWLIVGNTSSSSPRRCASSAPAGACQPRSTISCPSARASWPGGRGDEEEVRVEADRDLGGRDPARERDQRAGVGQRQAGLLGHLANGGTPDGGFACQARRSFVALAFGDVTFVHRTAGEDPGAAHEPRCRVAAQQQHLQRRAPAAQHDDARRLPRRARRAGVELLAGRGTRGLHPAPDTRLLA